jgi:hypothetical protein
VGIKKKKLGHPANPQNLYAWQWLAVKGEIARAVEEYQRVNGGSSTGALAAVRKFIRKHRP